MAPRASKTNGACPGPPNSPRLLPNMRKGIERLRPRCSQFEHGAGERGRNTSIAAHRNSPRRHVEGDDVLSAIVQGDACPTRTGADVEHATLGQFEGRVRIGGEVPRCVHYCEEAVRSLYQFVRHAGGSPGLLAGEEDLAKGIADRQLLIVDPRVRAGLREAMSCRGSRRPASVHRASVIAAAVFFFIRVPAGVRRDRLDLYRTDEPGLRAGRPTDVLIRADRRIRQFPWLLGPVTARSYPGPPGFPSGWSLPDLS